MTADPARPHPQSQNPTLLMPARPGLNEDPTIAAVNGPAGITVEGPEAEAATVAPAGTPGTARLQKARVLGPYTLLRLLGRGGMGAVWEAVDFRLDRHVALKVTLGDASPDAVERFRREAMHSARLRHPNIVSVHDVGSDGGRQYLVMDLVQGVTLSEALRAGRLTYRDKATLLEKICRAVHYAHEQGVVHRDLKPANIMLERARASATGTSAVRAEDARDERTAGPILPQHVDAIGEPLVMDFGLAKDTTSDSSLSQSGQAMGTPSYMPPEQAEGRLAEIGSRSDVYSLGAILYEMLTGRPPFTGGNVMQVLKAVINEDPIAPRRISQDVSRDLETICLTCLSKHPERRYDSAAALADDLRAWLAGDNIKARPATWLQRSARKVRRNRTAFATAALSIITLVGITAGFMWSLQAQRDAALRSEARATKALAESAMSRRAEIAAEQTRKEEEARRRALESQAEAERAREWHLVFADDFSDSEATDRNWNLDGTGSSVVDGVFRIPKSTSCVLTLKQPLAGDVRIDWECRFADSDIDDLSCFLCAESWLPGRQVAGTGYEFKSGAYSNIKNVLNRRGKALLSEPMSGLMPDHVYHARAEKIGARLRYSVDDHVLFDVTDPAPLGTGGAQASMGLTCWHADARWDNVKVYSLGPSLRADVLEIAGQQLAVGRTATASDLYRDVLEASADETRRAAARVGLARAEQQATFAAYRRAIADAWPTARVVIEASDDGTIRVSASGQGLTNLLPLHGMPIGELDLDGNHINDLAPLAGMPMRKLNLRANGPIDLQQLAGLPLVSLNIDGTGVADLESLRGMKLESFDCSNTPISSLEPLRGMPLSILSCCATRVTSLDPIHACPLVELNGSGSHISSFADVAHGAAATLRTLVIRKCGVDSLADLAGLHLTVLDCNDNRIADLTPLNGMPLTSLDCNRNRITTLEPLRGMSLMSLICSNNRISSIEPLRSMRSLVHLVADYNQIADIEQLRGLSLRTAGFTVNQLTSLEPLRGMPLESIGCAHNALTSIDPLRGCPLIHLNCGDNPLMDLTAVVAGIRTLERLDCWKTGISDLTFLSGLRLSYLRCSWNHITSLEPLRGMPLRYLDCNANPIRSLDPLPRTPLDRLQCAACPLDSLSPILDCPPKQGALALDQIPEEQVRVVSTWGKVSPRIALAASIQLASRHHDASELTSFITRCAGHRFLASTELRSATDAAMIAQRLGGHLAVVSTREEWDAIRPLQPAEENWSWLGGRRTSSGIVWLNGNQAAIDVTVDSDRGLTGRLVMAADGWHVYGTEEDGGMCQSIIEWDQ